MIFSKQTSIVASLLITFGLGFSVAVMSPSQSAFAAVQPIPTTCPDGTTIKANSIKLCPTGSCPKSTFFGLVPWYQYLRLDDKCNIASFQFLPSADASGKNIQSDIPLVLLAIVDDLLRIAGLLAVGFVIYGGIQYITSQGNPDGTAKAQSTVLNALIGLAVALIAVAGVSFVGRALGG